MACTPPKMQPVPMTAQQAMYVNVAEMHANGSTPMIAPPEPWPNPWDSESNASENARLKALAVDTQIEIESALAEQNRRRIEHALAETRKVFEARDAATQEIAL